MARGSSKVDETRALCESDLYLFAVLVGPNRVYGDIHKECFTWLSKPDALDQILLLPRGHLKSHMIAVWCAWWITKHPETTILYVSATEDLAILQLSVIKSILESDVYRRYWPDMIHPEEAKRDRWAAKDIKIDHPRREALGIRDATVAARGIDANTTGLHCDVLVLDDIVSHANAYTEPGRETVRSGYAQFSSVANPGSITKVVGTRYTGKDVYGTMLEMKVEEWDEANGSFNSILIFDKFERVVEVDNIFLWPRSQHPKTKIWYGYDDKVLAKIKAKYFSQGERIQFFCQYYNDVDAGKEESERIVFQYYNMHRLTEQRGVWYYNGKRLALFAGGDLAFTNKDTSDYTAFVVIGLDEDGWIYVLEATQFRTNKYDDYYAEIARLHQKWGFRKIRIESNAGANVIVEYIKDQFRKIGAGVVVEGKQARSDKSERTEAILMPRYRSNTIWHYKGGYMGVYEDQLTTARPKNDDLRDAAAIAVEIGVPPPKTQFASTTTTSLVAHPRFGGIRRA